MSERMSYGAVQRHILDTEARIGRETQRVNCAARTKVPCTSSNSFQKLWLFIKHSETVNLYGQIIASQLIIRSCIPDPKYRITPPHPKRR